MIVIHILHQRCVSWRRQVRNEWPAICDNRRPSARYRGEILSCLSLSSQVDDSVLRINERFLIKGFLASFRSSSVPRARCHTSPSCVAMMSHTAELCRLLDISGSSESAVAQSVSPLPWQAQSRRLAGP
jgi:hypothetical protein